MLYLYHECKDCRANPVPIETFGEESRSGFDEYENTLIGNVYNIYRNLDGVQLSSLTHDEGTPWYITWDNGRGINKPISNDLIEHHFKSLFKERTVEG